MGGNQSAQVKETRKATLEIKKETIGIEVDVVKAQQSKTKITFSGPEYKEDGTQVGQWSNELSTSEKILKQFAQDDANQRLPIEHNK